MGINELGVDEMGVDKMGSRRSGMTPFWFLEQLPILQIYELQCIWSKRKTLSQTKGSHQNKRT